MLNNRNFWIGFCALVALFYAVAAVQALQYGFAPRIVRFALIVLAVHVMEMPLAFKRLADRKPQPLRVVALTLLFGAAWWMPAQRGLFPVA